MADEKKGLPPKSPWVQPLNGFLTHSRKGHAPYTWTNMERPTSSAARKPHHLSTSDSSQLVEKINVFDESKICGNRSGLKDVSPLAGQIPALDNTATSAAATWTSEPMRVSSFKRDAEVGNPRKDERTDDSKRVKRIMANRLSAQKSRIKKLQYISDLEQRINSLQVKIGFLWPQVGYYDNRRLALDVENNAIKQRITSLMHEKLFKDAQFQLLLKDGEMLRQLYILQQQQAMMDCKEPINPNI